MRFDDYDCITLCRKFYESRKSIRSFCEEYSVPRTTLHCIIHKRLPLIDKKLYLQICERMKTNYRFRHRFAKAKRCHE